MVHDQKDGGVKEELFDLDADPAETKDLLESEPDVAATLRKKMREWQDSVLMSLSGADYRE